MFNNGDLVKLNSGRIGLVVSVNVHYNNPTVMIFQDGKIKIETIYPHLVAELLNKSQKEKNDTSI